MGTVQALVEVLVVWGLMLASLWATARIPALSVFQDWQRAVLGDPFVSQAALLVVLPLAVLDLLGRNPARYGIAFHQPGRAMEAGCTALAVLGPLSGLMFPFLAARGWSPYGWPGAWILTLGYGAAWPLVAFILRNQRPVEEPSSPRSQTASLLIGLGIVIALAALLRPHAPLVATVLNTLFFVGLGEELFFRGYVQSRLNEAFGRPYRLWGARFGPGMLLAALLFGLTHALNPAQSVNLAWGLWTLAIGLVLGHLREKSGTFVAPGVAHGVLMSVAALIGGIS